jgi:hypothetical protein
MPVRATETPSEVEETTMGNNYCENELRIVGPAGDISAFAHAVESDDELLSFQRLLPEPDIGALGSPQGWLNWRMTHWGCKWDAIDIERSQRSHTEIVYHYETPLGPALNPLRQASKRWPDLTFILGYAIPGSGNAGMVHLDGGRIIEERVGAYADICVSDSENDDTGHGHLGTLTEACRRLPESARGDAVGEVHLAFDADGPGSVENVESILLGLGDLGLIARYTAHAPDEDERTWRLITRAVGDIRGGAVLLALAASENVRTRTFARTASHLQSALLTPQELLGDGRDITAYDRIDAVRRILEQADEAGDLRGFAETLEGIARGWAGNDFDEFLHACWRLHF